MASAHENPLPYATHVEQSGAPATPAAGNVRMYRGTDGIWYEVDDQGNSLAVNSNVQPGGSAGGDLTGTYPNPSVGSGVLGDGNFGLTNPLGTDKIAKHEDHHLVGETGEPSFENSWENQSTSVNELRFWEDRGILYIYGQVNQPNAGDGNLTIFSLPSSHRPPENRTVFALGVNPDSTTTYQPIAIVVNATAGGVGAFWTPKPTSSGAQIVLANAIRIDQ